MLHSERPRVIGEGDTGSRYQVAPPQELLLAVASPPKTHSYELSGWPSWLIPAYQSGGHRPEVHLLEEDR
jgi:hypothetical protein